MLPYPPVPRGEAERQERRAIAPLSRHGLLVFHPWLCPCLAGSFHPRSIFLMLFGLKLVSGSGCPLTRDYAVPCDGAPAKIRGFNGTSYEGFGCCWGETGSGCRSFFVSVQSVLPLAFLMSPCPKLYVHIHFEATFSISGWCLVETCSWQYLGTFHLPQLCATPEAPAPSPRCPQSVCLLSPAKTGRTAARDLGNSLQRCCSHLRADGQTGVTGRPARRVVCEGFYGTDGGSWERRDSV